MRATVEEHGNKDALPNIEIDIVKGKEDVTVKISDCGGGISRSQMKNLFTYHYSTAPQPEKALAIAPLVSLPAFPINILTKYRNVNTVLPGEKQYLKLYPCLVENTHIHSISIPFFVKNYVTTMYYKGLLTNGFKPYFPSLTLASSQ